MKLHQIVNAQAALAGFVNNRNLPLKASYAIMKLAKAFETELQLWTQKQQELLQKHEAVPVEGKPGTHDIPEKNQAAFTRDIEEVLELEISAEFQPVPLKPEYTGISPADLVFLEPFITMEE